MNVAALFVAAIEEGRLTVAETERHFSYTELGKAWADEMAAREAELADRKRDLLAAQSEIYVSEAERALKVDRLQSSISLIQSDLIALGLVIARAQKVPATA